MAKFLADRDSKGRTQVHALGCEHFGKSGPFGCGCERHLSAGTVDSYIGQGLFQHRWKDTSLAAEFTMGQPLFFLSSAEIFKGNEA